ncbi:MAG: fructose-1,6-bisphosphatase [Oscillospiraceae bacterium]|nr:fructose-1,6-bisphosphatase [Oscillospiraceae bacterium]MDD4367556.1 fructose-1,6-bisphosphatase [Oscillospiraceae bacterium]
MSQSNDKYLRLLARAYPNIRLAQGEILRLQALNELPKGTEYFFSDLHGEDGAFIHLMRSASGNIRTKIRELYGNILPQQEQNQLANLVYDPHKVLSLLHDSGRDSNEWTRITIIRLTDLCRYISAKYAREDVTRKMPREYAPLINELLYIGTGDFDRDRYVNQIIAFIIDSGSSEDFILSLCELIQKICVNYLHIIGDIFDRGKGPHTIMEELIDFDRVDIQWGNHDVEWMGAAAGSRVCMCSVLRIALSYSNIDALEDGYALNLRALSDFAEETYRDDPCACFTTHQLDTNLYDSIDRQSAARMQKAIAVILFKLEGQLIQRHPEYQMDERNVLLKTDFHRGVYESGGKAYPLKDTNFPTIDPEHPLALTSREEDLMKAIEASFLHSERLQRHVAFLYAHGQPYKIVNHNLLFHGCIPLNPDGSFMQLNLGGRQVSGRALLDVIGETITQAYYEVRDRQVRRDAQDFMWYLWCGAASPMFGKSKMATFENYFLDDPEQKKEVFNPYYKLSQEEEICDRIFAEFGLDPAVSHIVNGHVPVKIKDGESPVKANGKLFVIDGGISKAYQPKTGIAGYTLIFDSHTLSLAEHYNFTQIESDMGSYTPRIKVVRVMPQRLRIADTDQGRELEERIHDLQQLIDAYRRGRLKESAATRHSRTLRRP